MMPRMFNPNLDWMDDASCVHTDPEAFFPETGANDIVRTAKRVCQGCTVRSECLSWAVENPELLGVLGGTTERERREIRKARAEHQRARGAQHARSSTAAP